MLTALAISNYRSLRKLVIPLRRLNLITGANGSGKSNSIVRSGFSPIQPKVAWFRHWHARVDLQSTLWAGPESISRAVRRGDYAVQGTRREQPVSLLLGFASDEFGYLIDMGLPTPGSSAFSLDPQIKRECIWHAPYFVPQPH
jgi:predicted ATPase